MTQPYIGRAAEAAARAKHNRIHKVKKTAKRKPAKKAPNKANKVIEEALGAFKPIPINQNALITEEGRKLFEKDVIKAEAAMNTAKELRPDLYFPSPSQIADPDEWTEYGPLGGQDEDAIAREVLGMEVGFPEETAKAQEAPSEPSEPALVQVVPEPPVKAPQTPAKAQSKSPVATCILNLIDALNFLHREGHLRKLPEKDILILKQRIKTGRQLIEKL